MSNQPTCAERISEHMASRLKDFGAMNDLTTVSDADELSTMLEDASTRALLADLLDDDAAFLCIDEDPAPFIADLRNPTVTFDARWLEEVDTETLRDRATDRLQEYPLGLSRYTTFRVELSTGGPGDWLEVICTGDTPGYEPAGDGEHYEPERIVYHFNDWFDHAELELSGVDFDVAERFARAVVPELMP